MAWSSGMADPLIVACLRHTDLRPDVDLVTGAVGRHRHGATASPAEFAALELALRVAGAWHGRVLALVAGPPEAEATLREAVAAGAGALRVDWPGADYIADLVGDEHALAVALADAVRHEGPALVICGDLSADRGTGALPAFLAHELGAAQALGLVSVRVDGDHLLAERRLPAGRREKLRIGVPAVCSVEAAGLRLRRAAFPAVLASRRAVIPVVAPAAPPPPERAGAPRRYSPRTHVVPAAPAGSPRERLLALTGALTHREPPAMTGPVSPAAAADELLGYLRRAGCAPPGAGTPRTGTPGLGAGQP
jgi:electron transfer flavoprotein beta subunit